MKNRVKNKKNLNKCGFGTTEEGIGGFDFSSMMGGKEVGGGAGGGYIQMLQGIASSLTSSTIAAAVDAIKHKGEEYRPVTMNTNRMMANGGIVPTSKVEVEGDEVAETPAGDILQFTGPSHEQGGIDANLPVGTKVYSDRISVDGKTMQERKKNRERALARVNKFLENDPTNGIHKNTMKRVSEINKAEEQADLAIQTIANQIYGQGQKQKLVHGTGSNGTGSEIMTPEEMKSIYVELQNKILKTSNGLNNTIDEMKQTIVNQDNITQKLQGTITPTINNPLWNGNINGISESNPPQLEKDNSSYMTPITSIPAKKMQINVAPIILPSSISKQPAAITPVDTTMDMTIGDKVGMAGQIQGALSPFFTTLMNRAGDKSNENHFQDFGVDALKANNDAKTIVAGLKNQALQDVSLKENAAIQRNRNSTRGLSTQRALDLSAYMGGLDASNKIYSNFATQMANLYGVQSTLENQQDQMVMSGAKDKAMEDKADRDNFFTQINQDMSNISTQTQKMGKNMNVQKANNDFLSLLPELSKYGLGIVYDENGKPVVTKVK